MKYLLPLFLTVAASCAAQDIPYTTGRGNQVFITMNVDGKNLHLLVDTGSQTTVFRKSIGSPGDPIQMQTASETVIAHQCLVYVGKVLLKAICGVDLPGGQDGLLGEDFLQQFSSVTFDHRAHVLRLEK